MFVRILNKHPRGLNNLIMALTIVCNSWHGILAFKDNNLPKGLLLSLLLRTSAAEIRTKPRNKKRCLMCKCEQKRSRSANEAAHLKGPLLFDDTVFTLNIRATYTLTILFLNFLQIYSTTCWCVKLLNECRRWPDAAFEIFKITSAGISYQHAKR